MMRTRTCRARAIREAGTSLVELLVVLTLLAVVLPTAYRAMGSMQNETVITSNRLQALNEAQVIMDRIAKDLRTGVGPADKVSAFSYTGATRVTFYASLFDPNGPVQINAYISLIAGTNVYGFHEDQTSPSAPGPPYNYNVANLRPRLDGRYVDISPPGQIIFTYFSNTGAQLPIDEVTYPLTGMSPGSLGLIDSIGISLTTRITPTAPATSLYTRIHVRNADYNPQGDQ